MSTDLSTKTVMVVDNGLFVDFARRLGETFKKVYYYSPWQSSFPRSHAVAVGNGFEEIERCNFPLKKADSIDLWVFPDLYHHDLQCFLTDKGARVFGARMGEELELYRWEFKKYLKTLGLPVAPSEKIIGMDSLRDHLKRVKNKFVKTSFVRGDFETFRHDSYDLSEARLDEIEHHLGPTKKEYEFIVDDEIRDAVEVGYDGFTVDGEWPSHAMMAYEVKDCGMVGVSLSADRLVDPVKLINSKLSPALKGYSYRGFLSTEIRYTKDKSAHFIDPCCRLGTPSNELLQELFDGWAEVVWYGAEGELKSPKVVAKYAVLAVVKSEFAVNDWMCVHCEKEGLKNLKLRYHTRVQGKDYVVPQVVGLSDLGGIVGVGGSLVEAIGRCKELCGMVKGYQVECSLDSLDKAVDVIQEGMKMGIRFGEGRVPTKEEVRNC